MVCLHDFIFFPWFDYKPCQQDVCMLFSVMLTRLGAFPGRCCWNSSGGGVSPEGGESMRQCRGARLFKDA